MASHFSHHCLNYAPHSHPWKTWLPWHWSLVPERLGTNAQKHFASLSTLSKEMWRESAFPLCSSRDAPTHSDNFKADLNDSVNQQWCSGIQKLPHTIQNHECFLLLTLSRANAMLEYLGVVYLRYERLGKRWSVASFSHFLPQAKYISPLRKRDCTRSWSCGFNLPQPKRKNWAPPPMSLILFLCALVSLQTTALPLSKSTFYHWLILRGWLTCIY